MWGLSGHRACTPPNVVLLECGVLLLVPRGAGFFVHADHRRVLPLLFAFVGARNP